MYLGKEVLVYQYSQHYTRRYLLTDKIICFVLHYDFIVDDFVSHSFLSIKLVLHIICSNS